MPWIGILRVALADFQPLTVCLKDGRALRVDDPEDIAIGEGTVWIHGESIDPSQIAAVGPYMPVPARASFSITGVRAAETSHVDGSAENG